MNPHLPPPANTLDAEERALAKALPRLHGRTAPGPDLDAGILAAAHASVRPARPLQPTMRPRVRWIAPAALAASAVLAVGLAWQLRPLPSLQAPQSEPMTDVDGASAVSMIEAPPAATDSPVVRSKAAPVAAAEPAPPEHSPAADIAQVASEQTTSPPPAPPAAPSAAMVLDARPATAASATAIEAQASGQVMHPTAAMQAAPAGADVMASGAASVIANKASMSDSARSPVPAMAPREAVKPELRTEADKAAGAGYADDPDEDIPPATLDSPAVRDAWLHRIRQLLDQGERAQAKASLTEFRRRYPDAVLPPALHALEIEP